MDRARSLFGVVWNGSGLQSKKESSGDFRRKRIWSHERLEGRHLLAADVILSEFLALNVSGQQDEDLEFSDWIEIHNRGDAAADLSEYYLTDDAETPNKWNFPAQSIAAGEYLVVFASGKDRAIAGAELHSNFRLDGGGEYLALMHFDGVSISPTTEFAPQYPRQFDDISYGIGREVEAQTLVDAGAEATYLIPSGPISPDWSGGNEPFDATGWSTGPTALGYDNNTVEPIADNFNRPDGTDIGSTSGGSQLWEERSTNGNTGVIDIADLVGGELRIHGLAGPGSTDPGQAILSIDAPDLEIGVDVRFGGINNPTETGTNNAAGFILRKPSAAAVIGNATANGQIDINYHPTGALLIRRNVSGSLQVLYTGNPFLPPFPAVANNVFGAAGALPTTLNGLPFDADGDGRLEEDEPHRIGVRLEGTTLDFIINGLTIVTVNTATTSSTPQNYFSLMKNRVTGAVGLIPTDPIFDNFTFTTPSMAPPAELPFTHAGDTDPTTEDWLPYDGAAITSQGAIDDGGTPAWNFVDDGGGRAGYALSLTDEQWTAASAAGWSFSGSLRVVNPNDVPDGAIELSVYDNGNRGFVLWFGSDESGNATVQGLLTNNPLITFTPSVTLSPGYHAYEMVYDPLTDTVDVFVDGSPTPAIENYGGITIGVSLNRILWGSNSTAGSGQSNWTNVHFDVAPGGDPENDFANLISTDVEAAMAGVSSTAYVRIPFEVTDPTTQLSQLRMRYDDGFVAYLNGVEIVRSNAPTTPAHDSLATASRTDLEALSPVNFNVSAFSHLLHVGTNVLAIHGLNDLADGSDFLVLPELFGAIVIGETDFERYFTTPTPGGPNASTGPIGFVADTTFSVDRGFYDAPFTVDITTATPDATIVYTLDGSPPIVTDSGSALTVVNGAIYTGAIPISTTTTLRAAAFKPQFAPTNVDTQTYIFLADVLLQDGTGQPTTWGTFPNSSSIGGTPWTVGQPVPADWDMDQSIVQHPDYSSEMLDDLRGVPTISLVMDMDDLFGSGGIYINPLERGDAWERPVSVEYLDPLTGETFHVNAGVRIHGGASRRPDQTRKHSFRLKFRDEYDGNGQLEYPFFEGSPFGDTATSLFDSLVLRGSYSDGFSVGHADWVQTNLRDQWARDAQLAMGQTSPHSKYVHVYVNGYYWGLYNATERIDGSFGAAYEGGDKDEFDVMTDDGLNEGTTAAWNQAISMAAAGLSTPAAYAAFQEIVDVDNLIDYMILQTHAGNWDWPQNNWLAIRPRTPDGRFTFPAWDVEVGLGAARTASGHDLTRNQTGVNTAGSPAYLYSRLRANAEFQLLFADHLHKHLFNDGALTPENAAALFQTRVDEIYGAIVPETARWGDHTGNGVSNPDLPILRDGEWIDEINWILETWFPQRTDILLDQFRAIGLYPSVEATSYLINGSGQHGGTVQEGDQLTIAAASGDVWYTLDGSDPRAETAILYTGTPITLAENTLVKSRVVVDSTWSALNEAVFSVETPLRITEIMYNPSDQTPAELAASPGGNTFFDNDDFEFVEIANLSTVATVNLGGYSLGGAITVSFDAVDLAPGEHVVVVRNRDAFQSRYGTEITIVGDYPNNLANGGETVLFNGPFDQLVKSIAYDDSSAWPQSADGDGYSLVPYDPDLDQNDPNNWRASSLFGGSPGEPDPDPLAGDFDGNGAVNRADVIRLLRSFGTSSGAARSAGDANRDGAVTLVDLALTQRTFGQMIVAPSPVASSAAAPESPRSSRLRAVRRAASIDHRPSPIAVDLAISDAEPIFTPRKSRRIRAPWQ